MKLRVAVNFLFCFAFCSGLSAFSSESGNYPLGLTGLKNGTMPPPGIYPLDYSFDYHATELKDRHGEGVNEFNGARVKGNINISASLIGLTYVSNLNLLGAQYSVSGFAGVQRVHGDVTLEQLTASSTTTGLSDTYIEPLNLSWHLPRFDLFTSYGVYLPTGKFHESDPSSPGRDRYAHQISTGMTAYLDDKKKWALSIVPRYEIFQHEMHRDRTGGQDFLFEWGLSRTFTFMNCDGKAPWGVLDVGAVGYNEWKTTPDKGSQTVLGDVLYQTHAAGVEASFMKVSWHAARFTLRYEREFGVIARTQGQMGLLGFTIKW
jgi:hypothetical protein